MCSNKTGSELLDRIESLRHQANGLETKFLEQAGWKYTCCTPGSYWLWKKTLSDSSVILVSQEKAMRIQFEEDMA